MVEERPVVVIGAGIVGLSIAYEISTRGEFCLVLESREKFAEGASSRNSEVIHGGFLSRKNSLKQRLCVIGGEEIKRRICDWGIEWKECGKIVVAVEEIEFPRLKEIVEESRRIGVEASWLNPNQVRELEPALTGDFSAAAWFPGSSVFDTHSYMEMMISKMENLGSALLLGTRVRGIGLENGFPMVFTQSESFPAKAVINATGVDSDKLISNHTRNYTSELVDSENSERNVQKQEAWPGCWYRIHEKSTEGMRRLVYRTSTPDQPGLGVHTTPDWSGNGIRLGPDSQFLPNLPESFDLRHKFRDSTELRKHFISRLGALYPHITIDDLIPDQVGIRSRAYDSSNNSDFIFLKPEGSPRTMHLLGMESPGITASPAIASKVADWLSNL